MSRFFSTLLLSLFIAAPAVFAEKKVDISFSPSISSYFGETKYTINVRQQYADSTYGSVIETIESELVFPLDYTGLGLNLRLNPHQDPTKWFIELGLNTGLNDPDEPMTDGDWYGVTNYVEYTKFSYTESAAEMSNYSANINLGRRLIHRGSLSFSIVGGARLQKIEQHIFGYEGWYRDFDTASLTFDPPVDISGTGAALDYKITFFQPSLGIDFRMNNNRQLSFGVRTLFSPVFYSDEDDHLLRGKLSKSDGDGLGFIGSFDATYYLSRSAINKSRVFVSLIGDMVVIDADGTQTQTWYEDEGEITAGTVIGGIPNEIKSTQYGIGLRVGMAF